MNLDRQNLHAISTDTAKKMIVIFKLEKNRLLSPEIAK